MHNKIVKNSRTKLRKPQRKEQSQLGDTRQDQVVEGNNLSNNAEFVELLEDHTHSLQYQKFDSLESTLQQIEDSATIMLLIAALTASVAANLILGGIFLVTSGTLEQILRYLGV